MTDVGPNALVWIERLRDVNATSKFDADERNAIEDALYRLSVHIDGLRRIRFATGAS
jgi:hypothetical protein